MARRGQLSYSEVVRLIEQTRATGETKLDLSGRGLTELPAAFDQLSQLQGLDLSGNQLSALPEAIGQLSHLQALALGANQLSALPEAIGQLSQLQRLDLGNDQLSALPEAIGQLRQLQSLDLSGNQLRALPEAIGQLSQLQRLDLSGNQLAELPEVIGQLSRLRSMNVSHNELAALPRALSKLARLEILSLAINRLHTLPESIGSLKQLRILLIGGNAIQLLPDSLDNLKKLTVLDVSGGPIIFTYLTRQLESGDQAFARFHHTKSGQLTALPESLLNIKSLKRLYIQGNINLRIPPEILGPNYIELIKTSRSTLDFRKYADPKRILNYYFRARRDERPLNEAKLILVGYGTVGKTSLVNRLIHDGFDQAEKETEGINISQWPISLRDGEDARLHIWDFGGQEIMHSTHQFFLTQRSLYLLVLNGRQGHEDADADYWLSLIDSFGEGSPVLVVLNKIKEHPFDLNRRGLKQKFGIVRGFIETDCKDRTGIEELKKIMNWRSAPFGKFKPCPRTARQ
jgi:internalin A